MKSYETVKWWLIIINEETLELYNDIGEFTEAERKISEERKILIKDIKARTSSIQDL